MSSTERIKVAMLGAYTPAPSVYGGSEHTRYLVKYLARRDDVELHIITLGHKNADFDRDGSGLYLHLVRKQFFFPSYIPHAVPALRRRVKRINPDIVHAQGASIPYGTTAALVQSKYPTVLRHFGFTPDVIKSENRLGVIKYLLIGKPNEKYVFSKVQNTMVTTSPFKNLISSVTNSKIYVVLAGTEFEEIKRIQPHQEEKPDIFSACRLHKVKGIDILIRAIPTVIKSIPDLKVCLAGSGPQEDELKSLVRELRVEGHVRFLGVIYGEEKYQYYKACKIVALPSRWEALGKTIVEAMASGKPVVASNVGGIPDVVDDGKTGLLFESENVEDLAVKMIKLLTDDELRERMGKAALEKAKEYDWGKIAERTVAVYRKVIADFHGQRAREK
ncbi:glycosyltransferase family 4 protein [Chloroflexota bacterium]